jgi:hypothetical protein
MQPSAPQQQGEPSSAGIHPYYVYDSYDRLQQQIIKQAWTLGILMFVLFLIVVWMFILLKKWFHRYCDKPKDDSSDSNRGRRRNGPYYRHDRMMEKDSTY